MEEYDDYDKVFSYKHIRRSGERAMRGVKWKPSIQRFRALKGLRSYRIFKSVRSRTYKGKAPSEFDLHERGHVRHIKARYIDDRIVQKTLTDYSLTPAISRGFIYKNSASLMGKGYHFAIKAFRKDLSHFVRLHGTHGYILLFDFHAFFESIRQKVCNEHIAELYTDNDLIALYAQLMAENGDSGFVAYGTRDGATGLGLGSQVSQISALMVADPIDHVITNRECVNAYGRYMDDGYVLSDDKAFLQHCVDVILLMCQMYGIELSEKKTRIVKLTHSFTFLQKRFHVTRTGGIVMQISRSSATRERRKLKRIKKKILSGSMTCQDAYNSYKSWEGYAKHGNSWSEIVKMRATYNLLFLDTPDDVDFAHWN